MRRIRSWFSVARETWLILLLGYIGVVISHIACVSDDFKQASGSLLVAASIIGQLLYDNMEWRKMFSNLSPGTKLKILGQGQYSYKKDRDDQNKKCTVTTAGFMVFDPNPSIIKRIQGYFQISQNRSEHIELIGAVDTNEAGEWFYQKTIKRIEYWVTYILAASIFLGTLTWGYGLNWFAFIGFIFILALAVANRPQRFIPKQ